MTRTRTIAVTVTVIVTVTVTAIATVTVTDQCSDDESISDVVNIALCSRMHHKCPNSMNPESKSNLKGYCKLYQKFVKFGKKNLLHLY